MSNLLRTPSLSSNPSGTFHISSNISSASTDCPGISCMKQTHCSDNSQSCWHSLMPWKLLVQPSLCQHIHVYSPKVLAWAPATPLIILFSVKRAFQCFLKPHIFLGLTHESTGASWRAGITLGMHIVSQSHTSDDSSVLLNLILP